MAGDGPQKETYTQQQRGELLPIWPLQYKSFVKLAEAVIY